MCRTSQAPRTSHAPRSLEPTLPVEQVHSSEETEVAKSEIRDKEIEEVRHEIGDSGIPEDGDGMVNKNDSDVVIRKALEGSGHWAG